MIQLYAGLAIVSLVGGVCYGGYQYYVTTQNQIRTLTENAVKLEMAKKQQDNTIKVLQEDQERFERLNKNLTAKLIEATKYKDTLITKLRKHDLTALSMKKPMLIEKRINNAVKKLLKNFEDFNRTEPSKSADRVQQSTGDNTSRSKDSRSKKKDTSTR